MQRLALVPFSRAGGPRRLQPLLPSVTIAKTVKNKFPERRAKEMCHCVTQSCWRETRLNDVIRGPSTALFLSGPSFKEVNRLLQ